MFEIASSVLHVRKLRLMVHLGCTPAEQKVAQPVDVDVALKFLNLPKGAASDELNETACYAEICGALKSVVADKSFRLVEKLGYDLFAEVKSSIPQEVQVWVSVLKIKPPIEDLNGGVSFSFGDWVPSAAL